jgi:hypothetical protein
MRSAISAEESKLKSVTATLPALSVCDNVVCCAPPCNRCIDYCPQRANEILKPSCWASCSRWRSAVAGLKRGNARLLLKPILGATILLSQKHRLARRSPQRRREQCTGAGSTFSFDVVGGQAAAFKFLAEVGATQTLGGLPENFAPRRHSGGCGPPTAYRRGPIGGAPPPM